ncbi:hypothetical protein [Leisingera thetidis]|uniref:hypothetical protein n=1 Tax=Leisingera thetidis TaxID=2930199 RepID=UPI0021F6EA92|nr:hypothetical protein [Leisingera thetidis]
MTIDNSPDTETPVEPDSPFDPTGESNSDDTLTSGTGKDTLTGNLNDADLLQGGARGDQLNLERGNAGTGRAGAVLFSVEDTAYWDDGDAAIRLTDFNRSEDQILLQDFAATLQLQPLEDEEGIGIFSNGGELMLALPGVEDLPVDEILVEDRVGTNGANALIHFEVRGADESEISVEEPVGDARYQLIQTVNGIAASP